MRIKKGLRVDHQSFDESVPEECLPANFCCRLGEHLTSFSRVYKSLKRMYQFNTVI